MLSPGSRSSSARTVARRQPPRSGRSMSLSAPPDTACVRGVSPYSPPIRGLAPYVSRSFTIVGFNVKTPIADCGLRIADQIVDWIADCGSAIRNPKSAIPASERREPGLDGGRLLLAQPDAVADLLDRLLESARGAGQPVRREKRGDLLA